MYAVPGIIAQTAASLYNMVDSIYIGHIPGVGADAISGLAVTFPLMNLAAAMGTLVGVGGMTLISVLLGQKNYDSAKKVLSNVFALNLLIGILFSIVTLSFLDPILYFFGASDRTIFYAREYMSIILWGNVVTHLYFGFNNLIRSSGHPKTAMGLTLFTVISNAILDPILIFGFDMGIKGAAIATVACQLAALLYTFRFFSDKSRLLHFTRPVLQIDRRIAGQCFAIGLGPFLMNAASSVVAMMINQQLGKYGSDMAIGAYGIVNRVTTFFIMICFGFNQGLQPIAGYNYGARQYHRVKEVFILTAKWEMLVTTLFRRIQHRRRQPLPVSRNGQDGNRALAFAPADMPAALPVSAADMVRGQGRMDKLPHSRRDKPCHGRDIHSAPYAQVRQAQGR